MVPSNRFVCYETGRYPHPLWPQGHYSNIENVVFSMCVWLQAKHWTNSLDKVRKKAPGPAIYYFLQTAQTVPLQILAAVC